MKKAIITAFVIVTTIFACVTAKKLEPSLPITVKVIPEENHVIVEKIENDYSLKNIVALDCESCQDIATKVSEVESSKCFHDFMINPSNKLDLKQSNGLTADEVVAKLLASHVDTSIVYYHNFFTSAVGYENGDGKIHANTKFWNRFSLCDKASTVGHEISHTLGFTHDFNATSIRPYSVPYRINAAFTECCK